MPNNLRIIANNLADLSTASVISTGSSFNTTPSTDATNYPVLNLFKDTKGLVWRAQWSANQVVITLGWPTAQTINSVVLPFTNLSALATMSVAFFSNGTATGTPSSTLAPAVAVPTDLGVANVDATGSYRYSYGGGTCARRYFATTTCQSIAITITDPTPQTTYAEISRVILGTYWSPTYNTEFGLSVQAADTSTSLRTQAGNLVTDGGTLYKNLNFALNFLTPADRTTLLKLLYTNGKRKSVWVTLFPEDAEPAKEVLHQIYGRLTDTPAVSHPMFNFYATSLQIDEV